VDAQRYVHTYGWTLRLDLLGRLGRVDKKFTTIMTTQASFTFDTTGLLIISI